MTKINVMSVNIRYQNEHDKLNWDTRKNVLFNTIRKYNPDIIGFQEVMRSTLEDLVNEFSEYEYYGEFRDETETAEMNPIFTKKSKFSMVETSSFWLSESPNTKYTKSWDSDLFRVCSCAKIKHNDSTLIFTVVNTHFDHIGEKAREESSKLVIKKIFEFETPVILTGDFNTTPEMGFISKLLNHRYLDNSFNNLKDKENSLTLHNFTSETKGSPIDYIFVTQPFEIMESTIIRDKQDDILPSDHYPIFCELEI